MQIGSTRSTIPSTPVPTVGDRPSSDVPAAQDAVATPPALDRFVPPRVPVTTMPLPDPHAPAFTLPGGSIPAPTDWPVTIPRPPSATVDLGVGAERSAYGRTAKIYSGAVTASLINQRGPMTGSHTSSRETAVSALEFVDQRGFFGGAASVEVELVPQHTIIDRSSMGGHLREHRRSGVLDETAAVRVRLDRGSDGVYRAAAGDNRAFFVTDSETGYARRVLEDIKISVRGTAGVEDTAYGARYGLL